jgi:hypothetical protein
LLAQSTLQFRSNSVVLEADDEAAASILFGEQTSKRAATLAGLLDKDLKMRAATRERVRETA